LGAAWAEGDDPRRGRPQEGGLARVVCIAHLSQMGHWSFWLAFKSVTLD